ncbi:hypothetical protein L2E82_25314 [Cichorium intybus]|uniref:Uncharacterized protein n=1 Tax=Cichorium intybus TaxID=13427 RepID=A0ACB9E494_CICIN|nr:hypothetical protein L2E82_25314 [Cichorium intybus]
MLAMRRIFTRSRRKSSPHVKFTGQYTEDPHEGFLVTRHVVHLFNLLMTPNRKCSSRPRFSLSLHTEARYFKIKMGFSEDYNSTMEATIKCELIYKDFAIDVTMAPVGMNKPNSLPLFVLLGEPIYKSIGFIIGLTLGILGIVITYGFFGFIWIKRKRRITKEKEDTEDWELEY